MRCPEYERTSEHADLVRIPPSKIDPVVGIEAFRRQPSKAASIVVISSFPTYNIPTLISLPQALQVLKMLFSFAAIALFIAVSSTCYAES